MNNYKVPFLLIIFIVISSCGSRNVGTAPPPVEDVATASVISNHYDKEVEFETLQGRLGVRYETETQDQSVAVSFRMKKDDSIWMSAQVLGFPVAKVLITPENVQYYEKIGQTSFNGDFDFLSDLLGTPLDFEKVQNLLIGQTIYDLRDEPYKLTESVQGYQLEPVKEGFLEKIFLLNAGNYKTLAQQISQKDSGRSVTITYSEYQMVDGRVFPEEIEILATEGSTSTKINMDFRSLEFDVPVSFPFSIPSGYEEISVE